MKNLFIVFFLSSFSYFNIDAQISKKNFNTLSNEERLDEAKDCLNKLIGYHRKEEAPYCYDCFNQDLREFSTFYLLYINAEKEFQYVKEIKSTKINGDNKIECTLTYYHVQNANKSQGGPKATILNKTYDCKMLFEFTEEGLSLLLGCY